ncbi:Cytoplasmic GTPase/eEF2-like protein (ribosomal biogenesis), partial [Coemansia guatemalensis]
MDQEKIDKVVNALGIKVLPRDRRSKDRRTLLTAIMQGWLPLAQACMAAVVEQLPSPADAQPLRLPHLVQGKARVAANSEAAASKEEVEKALYECIAGTADAPAPLVAYIGKVVSIPRTSLPEFSDGKVQRDRTEMTADEMRALGRDAVRRELALGRESAAGTPMSALSPSGAATSSSSGVATPMRPEPASEVSVDSLADAMNSKLNLNVAGGNVVRSTPDPDADADEVLVGFGRLYSGTISVGDKLWAMQPKYNAKNPKTHGFLKQVTVRALYMMMGRELVRLQSVPAGNVCGIRGVAGAILKSGTLASDAQTCPNLAAMHTETYPIVRVALEPMNPQDMARLAQGLALLNQADPCVQVHSQNTGEHVLVTAGELHLERCLKDLRERFAQCEIHVSEPIVPFREGIVRQSAQPNVVLGEVGSSGRLLAMISNYTPESSEASDPEGPSARTAEGTPRGEVSLTTANGLVTVTIQVEPLPEKTTRFLMRHEADIQRFVRLTSSQRRHRLNAAAEALDEDNDD